MITAFSPATFFEVATLTFKITYFISYTPHLSMSCFTTTPPPPLPRGNVDVIANDFGMKLNKTWVNIVLGGGGVLGVVWIIQKNCGELKLRYAKNDTMSQQFCNLV